MMKVYPTAVNPLGRVKPAPADPNAGLREPGTDGRDRRNYACANCGRTWRKFSRKWRCPHCGYARKARP